MELTGEVKYTDEVKAQLEAFLEQHYVKIYIPDNKAVYEDLGEDNLIENLIPKKHLRDDLHTTKESALKELDERRKDKLVELEVKLRTFTSNKEELERKITFVRNMITNQKELLGKTKTNS